MVVKTCVCLSLRVFRLVLTALCLPHHACICLYIYVWEIQKMELAKTTPSHVSEIRLIFGYVRHYGTLYLQTFV